MNWRKGLFRLWAVATVLWIGSFGALVYGDVESYIETERKVSEKPTVTFKIGASNGLQHRVTVQRTATKSEIIAAIEKARIEGLAPDASAKIAEDAIKGLSDDIVEQERKLGILKEYGAIALGVPTAILVIGVMLAWAFSGFSRRDA